MDPLPQLEPLYSVEQREELGRIAYHLSELRALRDREFISDSALATVIAEKSRIRDSIEKKGQFAAVMKMARSTAATNPQLACRWAEKACRIAPEQLEAWELYCEALVRLSRWEEAIETCRTAIDVYHQPLESRLASCEAKKVDRDRATVVAEALTRARRATASRNHEEALAAGREILSVNSRNPDALVIVIRSLVALDRFEEAEAACAELYHVRPQETATWARVIQEKRELQTERETGAVHFIDDSIGASVPPGKASAPVEIKPAGPRWSEIAGEFLEDHWQKLILSLAVLLIVVSSTVGAAMVLGDRFWMAEGKCLLATAYTLMFAGFGRGLSRWGAVRAGRIMRLTTLIVLPVSFALVGELPGLGRSSITGLAVLAADSLAMMVLVWVVCRSLGISGGRGTPIALMILGMLNALTPRSISEPWGLTAMVAASAVFAISAEWLGSWLSRRRESEASEDDAPYFAFGLLSLYAVCAIARIGAYVLRLPPTLYSLPVMVIAASAVRVSYGLKESGESRKAVELLRLAGYSASALAFALALSRPLAHSAVFSGNTLATAIVGFLLYLRSLVKERKPAFLYASFAALVLAYFGSHLFVKDIIGTVQSQIAIALGYGPKLPIPFKALNGLAFNVWLAVLSLFFSRRWNDKKLALHCHYIGLPVSIAACVLSAFEPLAAVLTMSGYVVAFGVASWLFASPSLLYLACAAFTGTSLAGSTFLHDSSDGARSLALSLVAGILWIISRILRLERIQSAYRTPFLRSARVVACLALVLTAGAVLEGPTRTSISSLWILAVIYVFIGLETPQLTVSYAAVSCAAFASILTIRWGTFWAGVSVSPPWLAAWTGGLSLVYQFLSVLFANMADAHEVESSRESHLRPYLQPLSHQGWLLAGIATLWSTVFLGEQPWRPSTQDLAGISIAMLLASAGMLVSSAVRPHVRWLPAATVAGGAYGLVALGLTMRAMLGSPLTVMGLGVSCAGASLVFALLGDRLRHHRDEWVGNYRNSLLSAMFCLVATAWWCGFWNWEQTRLLTVLLGCTSLTLMWAIRPLPRRPMPELALMNGLVTWLVGWGSLNDRRHEALPHVGLLILGYVLLSLAVTELIRFVGKKLHASVFGRMLGGSLPDFAGIATLAALAMGSQVYWGGDFRTLTINLAMASIVFLWSPRFRHEEGLLHVGFGLAWLATCAATRWRFGPSNSSEFLWIFGPRVNAMLLGWLAFVSAIDGLVFVALGWGGRKIGLGNFWLKPVRDLGKILTVVPFILAIVAASTSLDCYVPAVLALVLLIPALVLNATMDRQTWRVYASILAGVSASYVTMFYLGRGREGHVSSLGVLASILAIVCWTIERITSRWLQGDWTRVFTAPVRTCVVLLAFVAVLPEWNSPRALLLACVPFFLLIKSFPRPEWLYPALGLIAASVAFAVMPIWGTRGLIPSSVLCAFVAWTLGLALWRWKNRVCRIFRLPENLHYERPLYDAAVALGLCALGIWIDQIAVHGWTWRSHSWVPAIVAILSLLMLKPDPRRVWVDGCVALVCVALIAFVGSAAMLPMSWSLVILSLSLMWRMAQWGALPVQEPVCRRIGVDFSDIAAVLGQWALGLLAIGTIPLALRIGSEVPATAYGFVSSFPATSTLEWWSGFVAILLFAANLDIARRTSRFDTPLLPHLAMTMLLWWLTIPISPLMQRLLLDSAQVLPLVSVVQAVLCLVIGMRWGRSGVIHYGGMLSLVAIALTEGRAGYSTTAVLFASSGVQAALAARFRRPNSAAIAATLTMLAFGYASRDVIIRLGLDDSVWALTILALGQLCAASTLVSAGWWGRRRGLEMASLIEGFGIASLIIVASSVGLATLSRSIDSSQALVDAGAMFVVASLCVILASRRNSVTLAFAAQAAILIGYAAFRSGFSVPQVGDSLAMLLLAGIDLGIAEITGRGGRRLFAIPAFAAGLALPLLSVGLSLRNGLISEQNLFVLFAAGTFYAATSGRLKWKSLGYVAAVLYNATLWVLWSYLGWNLSKDPQLFVVPVGFSTILFAEANRRDLGRTVVNAIRGVGLTLIYLSLAVPIWQEQSFAAWTAILGVSLLGIFAGIGLKSQAFLWLGLGGFLLDVTYQLGRIGMEHALAKWAIMLALGLALVGFVALNEKKKLILTLRKYVDVVRQWE